jgi:outer membrane immunogenic protein
MLGASVGKNNVESLPFYLNMDYFATDDLSFGYQMIFGGKSETINNWAYGTFNYSFGLTANYHLNTLLNISYKWDFYLGANGGYNLGTTTPKNWNAPDVNISSNDKFYAGGQLGARYYFTDVLGVNIEGVVGTFRSGGNIGITLKF